MNDLLKKEATTQLLLLQYEKKGKLGNLHTSCYFLNNFCAAVYKIRDAGLFNLIKRGKRKAGCGDMSEGDS